jgi:hypothetical protein
MELSPLPHKTLNPVPRILDSIVISKSGGSLAASKHSGFIIPVVIDSDSNIIVGHGRLRMPKDRAKKHGVLESGSRPHENKRAQIMQRRSKAVGELGPRSVQASWQS